VLELLKQYRSNQLSQEGFAAIFDVLHRAISGILPKETYELTSRLYSLCRDLGDPDPRFCSSPAQLDAEIESLTPKLEALYLGALEEPFFSLHDPDGKL
jgi:transcriptional regulator with XRE-family HTH domain